MVSILTVTNAVYFQSPDAEPQYFESLFSEHIETEEQPILRVIKVGPEAKQIDYGWLKNPSQIVIRNDLPLRQVNPTLDERKQDIETVVYCDGWPIVLGQSMRGRPPKVPPTLQCLHETKVTVFIVP